MKPVFYLFIIALILGLAFLSQKPFLLNYGKTFYLSAAGQSHEYWAKASKWIGSKLGKTQAGEPAGGGEPTKPSAQNRNNNIFENVFLKK